MNAQLVVAPEQQIKSGQQALKELKALVQRRPDKLVIGGKQYLFFSDWQILGAFFGITTKVMETAPMNVEKRQPDSKVTFIDVVGYWAKAEAVKNGEQVSIAEAICTHEEPNWKGKPNFQLLSMAQTRACAKALRNCLQWVVRLPDSNFAEESAEEAQGEFS